MSFPATASYPVSATYPATASYPVSSSYPGPWTPAQIGASLVGYWDGYPGHGNVFQDATLLLPATTGQTVQGLKSTYVSPANNAIQAVTLSAPTLTVNGLSFGASGALSLNATEFVIDTSVAGMTLVAVLYNNDSNQGILCGDTNTLSLFGMFNGGFSQVSSDNFGISISGASLPAGLCAIWFNVDNAGNYTVRSTNDGGASTGSTGTDTFSINQLGLSGFGSSSDAGNCFANLWAINANNTDGGALYLNAKAFLASKFGVPLLP